MPGDDDRLPLSGWAVASATSSSLIGPVILGILLDTWLDWKPWATIAGVLLGLLGCLALLIRMNRQSMRGKSNSDSQSDRTPGGQPP